MRSNRYRYRGGFSTVVASYTNFRYNTSSTTTTTSASTGVLSEFWDTTGPYDPNRPSNNPFTKKEVTQVRTPGSFNASLYHTGTLPTGGIYGYSGSVYERDFTADFGADALLPHDVNGAINQAMTSALAKVIRPNVSSLVAMKEFQSTVAAFRSPVKGAYEAIVALRKYRGIRKAINKGALSSYSRRRLEYAYKLRKKALGNVADQHLSIVFGMMPFVNDIKSSLKALREAEFTEEVHRVNGSGSRESFSKRDLSNTNVGAYTTTVNKDYVTYLRVTNVKAYISYKGTYSLQHKMGLDLNQIPFQVWQGIPYSFLADWFVNVGDYIAGLSALASVSITASGYTIDDIKSHEGSHDATFTATRLDGWNGATTGERQSHVLHERSRVPAAPFVGLAVKNNIGQSLGLDQVSSLVSLITQRLTR